MDGVLIIDKPVGVTSHDVVNRVRRVLKTKRVGHAGTLDPFATGVLVLLIGKATRLAQFVDKDQKEYIADIRFGYATDTGDLTGNALGEDETPEISIEDIERVLTKFRGRIRQMPPMFSAKKVGGKKLYELARKGETVERKPFDTEINELEILEADVGGDEKKIKVRVECSAGTYIRTLAVDIGKALRTGAHLTALRRTRAGDFLLENAVGLEEFEQAENAASLLLSIETLVSELPSVYLPNERLASTLNGMSTRIDRGDLDDGASIAIFVPDGNLIAVGVYDAAESCIKPRIVLG